MNDFSIIGGGIIGMMIARELALDGATVELFESGETGQQASWAGGGILSPLHPWRYPDPLLRLATRSQSLFQSVAEALHQATGIDPQWQQCGLLIVDGTEREQALTWGERWQMPLKPITGQDLHACEPALNPGITEGLFLPTIAQIRNPRLLTALKAHLKLLKVRVHPQTRINGFEIHGDRVTGLQSSAGQHPINAAILCAGAWGGQLLATTGLDLPLQPVRGQMIIIKTPPGTVSRVILRGSRYLIPRRDGRVLVGSTIEYCGFDQQTTPEAREDLYAAALEMAPVLADFPVEHHWSGLRPGSPSGVPYIGPHPVLTNLHSALGHFRNGLMLAPATAELIKNLVTHSSPTLNASDYDHQSFVDGTEHRADAADR